MIHTHGAQGQETAAARAPADQGRSDQPPNQAPPHQPSNQAPSGWEKVLATAQDWTPGGIAETLLFTAAMAGTAVGLLVGAIVRHAVLGAVIGCLTGLVGWPLLGLTAYRRVRARARRRHVA